MSKNTQIYFKILKIKRGSETALLTIDSLEKPVNVPIEFVNKEILKVDMVISGQLLNRITVASEQMQCESKAAGILSRRDHSVGEFKRKLRMKEFDEDAIDRAVSFFKKKGILDDHSYAEKIVKRQLALKPAGKRYLISLLRSKMIARDLAESTVESLFETEDELSLAVKVLSKRWNRYSQFELEEARRKAYNYLSQKGFNYGTAKDAFDQVMHDQEEFRD